MTDTANGFSADERAAMKQRAEELRTTKGLKGAAKLAKEFEACVAAIDALEGTDKAVATALHRIVLEVAPQLEPKTWYGFPSYAQGGKVVVFTSPPRSSTPATARSASRRTRTSTTGRCGPPRSP